MILLDNYLNALFIFFFPVKTAYIFLENLVINLHKEGCRLFIIFTWMVTHFVKQVGMLYMKGIVKVFNFFSYTLFHFHNNAKK